MIDGREIAVTINGERHEAHVETRMHLADFLRQQIGLTGTHLGCEHGVCGACTVIVDGEAARSCLMLAVQANGTTITTIEGLADAATATDGNATDGNATDGSAADDNSQLHPVQKAFQTNHGLQCGFCTPGMVMSLAAYLDENPSPDERDVREAISGNICRCTGYQGIVAAGLEAAVELRANRGRA